MELRHLRYFVAVAEAGSLTVAAEQRLHTSQPSLSRQIRDLEDEVGAQLLKRGARGIELTPAGPALLHHTPLVASPGEEGGGAAPRGGHPPQPRRGGWVFAGAQTDGRRTSVTCFRTELSAFLCNESSSQGIHADDRAGARLQKVK